ncbi:hypothetical protein CIPAW_10G161000 [Carya illinoinensis]|uniref:Uncharacterized protein n=1 Tax=Carya illinoinensis TaxID=32201 RepID=A0A8T1PC42_CARIL|nr:hypothetical protein CIPAW_10G161000 [Carya illinoinensis]
MFPNHTEELVSLSLSLSLSHQIPINASQPKSVNEYFKFSFRFKSSWTARGKDVATFD